MGISLNCLNIPVRQVWSPLLYRSRNRGSGGGCHKVEETPEVTTLCRCQRPGVQKLRLSMPVFPAPASRQQ